MKTFFQSVLWSEDFKSGLNDLAVDLNQYFQNEKGVQFIQKSLSDAWSEFNTANTFKDVKIKPLTNNFADFLNSIETYFSPSAEGGESGIIKLSDGMKSLFYFTLIKALLDLQKISKGNPAFSNNTSMPPLLTIIAVEEPENHLAPHYLGRITNIFRKIAQQSNSQVIITSHAPSILKRIEPEEVLYLRLEGEFSMVSGITLPDDASEAYKYVKDAVKAYPEIYFAKCVVFGEGESELIVLPKIFEALKIKIDESFLSVVPLGGRHVNHFWKLCSDLKIPFVTLLDYDNCRGGGNWGRIKYALQQLIANGYNKDELLKLDDGNILSDERLSDMHNCDIADENQQGWIKHLENYNIFFSKPYDLDYMMLEAFSDDYTKLEKGQVGPNIPKEKDKDYSKKCISAIAAVRKKDEKDIPAEEIDPNTIKNHFWYRYLFLGQGKPVTHLKALSNIELRSLENNCPEVIKRLAKSIQTMISEN